MRELTPVLVEKLRSAYELGVWSTSPLPGGYDVYAQSWRVETDRGALVVRADRGVSPVTAGWLADVVRRAADAGVPCCPPLRAGNGAAAFCSGDVTFTVRRFVEGCGLDRENPAQLRARPERRSRSYTAPWPAPGATVPR